MQTTSSLPQIFDPVLVRQRLQRAYARGYETFLFEHLTHETCERLSLIKRDFSNILIISPAPLSSMTCIQQRYPQARVSCMVPIHEATSPKNRESLTFVGSTEALPLKSQSFDLIISLMGLEGCNDLPGGLIQLARALQPDGLFLGCVLGVPSLQELKIAFNEAEAEEGIAMAHIAPMLDVRDAGGLLQRAGLALPVADTESLTLTHAHGLAVMQDLRHMGATSSLSVRPRKPLPRSRLMRVLDHLHSKSSTPEGRIKTTLSIIWLSGWAPHHAQQKPLKPGSAKTRLAAALGTEEIALKNSVSTKE